MILFPLTFIFIQSTVYPQAPINTYKKPLVPLRLWQTHWYRAVISTIKLQNYSEPDPRSNSTCGNTSTHLTMFFIKI